MEYQQPIHHIEGWIVHYSIRSRYFCCHPKYIAIPRSTHLLGRLSRLFISTDQQTSVLVSTFLGINFIHKTCMLLISLLTMWCGFIVLFCDRKSIPLWIIEVQVLSLYRMRNLTLYANKIRPLMLSTIHSHMRIVQKGHSVHKQLLMYVCLSANHPT